MKDPATRIAVVSLVVAGGSLFIGGASLAWQIILALRVDRARLSCEVGAFVAPKSDGTGTWEVITVSATNVGKRPTRLNSLWVVVGRPPSRLLRLFPSWLKKRVAPTQGLLLPPLPHNSDWEMAYYSTMLPADLDVGGTASIHYKKEMVHQHLGEKRSNRTVYGLATATTAKARSKDVRL